MGRPRRYRTGQDYIRLRWRLADGTYVEVYEHRVVDGRVTTAEHVHHRNSCRDDNRPENLELVTRQEHGVRHRDPVAAIYQAEYEAGATLVDIAARYGKNTGTVHRMLVKRGVAIRSASDYARRVDPDMLRGLHRVGFRTAPIAARLGETRMVIERQMRELGLTPHRPGRPTNAELAAQKDFVWQARTVEP